MTGIWSDPEFHKIERVAGATILRFGVADALLATLISEIWEIVKEGERPVSFKLRARFLRTAFKKQGFVALRPQVQELLKLYGDANRGRAFLAHGMVTEFRASDASCVFTKLDRGRQASSRLSEQYFVGLLRVVEEIVRRLDALHDELKRLSLL